MNTEMEQLRQYTRARQTVVDVIRAGKNALHELGFLDKEEQFQALVVKLAEDRFNLAIVGQFKRGKSSLMNAIIGRDLLPTGLLPLTSAITTLCYGPEEKVVLQRKGWIFEQEIELDELAEYVTERGNPGNEKGLVEARVKLPVPFLRRGLFFIDTPGIGSANQTSTATTYDFLPEADAVILVTSVEAPMSAVEERFLQDIRKYVRKLFVVVNKIDLLSAQERPPMIDHIHSTIAKSVGMESIRLFPVSSRLGLQAKQQRRPDQLVESGLEAFETELSRFLAKDKSRLFLISILDRAVDVLAIEPEKRSQSGHNGHEDGHPDELQEIRSRLQTLRQEFMSDDPLPYLVEKIQPTSESGDGAARLLAEAIAEQKTKAGSGQESLVRPIRTCPICVAQSRAAFDFFAGWQYALATNTEARREFSQAKGFCHVHTWQFQQVASPVGISEGYTPLIEQTRNALQQLDGRQPVEAKEVIQALLSNLDTCPACQMLEKVEGERVAQFIEQIAHAEAQEQYARSQGLCLPHLAAVLTYQLNPQVTQFLLDEQARRLDEISEDLHSFVLKRDALRRGLVNTNENDAWLRALILISGERTARVI